MDQSFILYLQPPYYSAVHLKPQTCSEYAASPSVSEYYSYDFCIWIHSHLNEIQSREN